MRAGNSPLNLKEFRDEFGKFVLIARLLRSYKNGKPVNLRLLVNHVIVLYNVFGNEITPYFFVMSPDDIWSELNSILSFFSFVPETNVVYSEFGDIFLNKYPANQKLKTALEIL